MLIKTLAWRNPLHIAQEASVHALHWGLLYSGQQHAHTGRYSYLGLHPLETVRGEHFSVLAARLSNNRPTLDNAWFGYLGYELLHDMEHLPHEQRHATTLPRLCFTRFGIILVFDHLLQSLVVHHEPECPLPDWLYDSDSPPPPPSVPKIAELRSSMTRSEYLDVVAATQEAIAQGQFYQANITRKFMGSWESEPNACSLFLKLCNASPAPYSAFMQMGDTAIISSSPECFISITADGRMETRPIKGTAARASDPEEDALQYHKLNNSEKDRAENLMIVDLMRNDLARSCQEGSVRVEKLFEVTTYATLHHMASTISGQKREDVSTLDAIKHCFPPGSMTGAPKIRAMEWCIEHERIQRGVYSGTLGWFGGDGSCDLSVVIRTLVVQGNHFEFQVGGGIVADSIPEKEWQETMTKARGIMHALGEDLSRLQAL